MGSYTTQGDQIVNQIAISIANWSTAMAVESIKWLLASLGQSTEPDLGVIVPVYDRMLAISLLLLGAVVALALIERVAWGSLGTSLAIVPRVVAATFFAYAGFGAVKYVAGYSALLATAWSPDFNKLTETLVRHVAASNAATQAATTGAHVSTFGLIVTALLLSCLTVMVHLELVVRSALILTITSFVPLVSVMSIWPRLAKAATTLSEFLIGLLLSKFVVATAVFVGFRLVVTALVSPTDTDTTENWMASGVAVLLIAAFSPVVIFTSLRFAHAQAGGAREASPAPGSPSCRQADCSARQGDSPHRYSDRHRPSSLHELLDLSLAHDAPMSADQCPCFPRTARRGAGNRRRIRFPAGGSSVCLSNSRVPMERHRATSAAS